MIDYALTIDQSFCKIVAMIMFKTMSLTNPPVSTESNDSSNEPKNSASDSLEYCNGIGYSKRVSFLTY